MNELVSTVVALILILAVGFIFNAFGEWFTKK